METLHAIIGEYGEPITWWQMVIRAVIVFLYLMILIRIGGRRAFGQSAAFDVVLGVLLGSALSRCLTGNSPFFPTLAAGLALLLLHMALARLSIWSDGFNRLVRGDKLLLVENGRLLPDALKAGHLTENDLNESLRQSGSTDLSKIRLAYLERSGEISFVEKNA